MTGLRGRLVVVTGAGGALGVETSRRLLAAGARVAAVDHRAENLEAPAAEFGADYLPFVVDLLDEPATLAWGHELAQDHGGVGGLLHLVGGWRGGKGIVDADLADWDFLHDNLIRTLQHTSRALHDSLRASSDARLAIISSTGVAKPTATNASYVAAKAASEAWTLAVADSFDGSQAAAAVLRVMALLTPQMRADKPNAKFSGFTPVEQVAGALLALWDEPADRVNGRIVDLTIS